MRKCQFITASAIVACIVSGCAASTPNTAVSTGVTTQAIESSTDDQVQVQATIAAKEVTLLSAPSIITEEQAKDIAIKHAEVKTEDILYSRVQLDWDDGIQKYEVDFIIQGKEYDYDIAASTGEILSFDYDVEYASWKDGALVEATPAASGIITEEEAKDFAIKHAEVKAEDILYSRAQLDWDDGIQKYEVNFFTQGKEYDYDIAASTGEILSFDYDVEYASWKDGALVESAPASQTEITMEAAKQKVIDKIGNIKADQIWLEKDYDDGRLTYEGEVYHNNMEYEFEIDVLTGEFISWSVESIYD